MAQIDKIRAQCLAVMEEQFATQMSKLVDKVRLEDAEALVQEMMIEADDFDDADLFLDDITDWSESDIANITFQDINDVEVDRD
tara:strand:- start:4873 stop:5124 length:252 start_codon:yes stop_codon:yes gene_type:complete